MKTVQYTARWDDSKKKIEIWRLPTESERSHREETDGYATRFEKPEISAAFAASPLVIARCVNQNLVEPIVHADARRERWTPEIRYELT